MSRPLYCLLGWYSWFNLVILKRYRCLTPFMCELSSFLVWKGTYSRKDMYHWYVYTSRTANDYDNDHIIILFIDYRLSIAKIVASQWYVARCEGVNIAWMLHGTLSDTWVLYITITVFRRLNIQYLQTRQTRTVSSESFNSIKTRKGRGRGWWQISYIHLIIVH